ncbi:SDR family NAD(P)-dependent oxidoreductase [Ancylobacter pratisalsi]|uniref:SDR family NAD(P)-dependent oxidoreductase n=1 Tax=Ancylobacter pratisalsi TaxID=1745854 RepID=A0A6P1YH21_9HYPH|nr:SDR family NAD(P)-dependent oxidoreductase [Ancylobacter pratisalsi]QIB32415.1 SDR family NAD(P)-dependent oxidoreductase [Ancylobacter pratisalsi]
MTSQKLGTAVVTGASSGIGKTYAERLSRRGYDLVLVARNRARLEALAAELSAASPGCAVDVHVADLGTPADVAGLAARISSDPSITLLLNNAGAGTEGPVIGADIAKIDAMVQLNVVALTQLSVAAVNAFVQLGGGTLINIASVVALMPETLLGAYSATKAYVLALTQSLGNELQDRPVRLQAVLPGLTRTEFFDRSGVDLTAFPPAMVMEVDELVDAALAGLDMGETITIPSLPDAAAWERLVATRMEMMPGLSRDHAAPRYGLGTGADD